MQTGKYPRHSSQVTILAPSAPFPYRTPVQRVKRQEGAFLWQIEICAVKSIKIHIAVNASNLRFKAHATYG